jgi:plasmid segregation protein ParM
MTKCQLIGVDLGFGFIKGFDGRYHVIIPSRLSERGLPQEVPDDGRLPRNGGLQMMVDDDVVYVGRGADCDWRSPLIPRQPDRLFGDYGKHLVLAVLSAYAEREIPLKVVIGLPVNHFALLKQSFEDRLLGYHRVAWVQADGRRIPRNVHIRCIHFVIHPMGTFSGLIMDADGRMVANPYRHQKVALVDIGFRATNVIVMDRMRYSKRGSATIGMGISRGLAFIDGQLRRRSGHRLPFDQLYQAVRLGHIRIDAQFYNLERVRQEAFSRLATELAGHVGDVLAPQWDLDRLLLTGGGSRELADAIGPLLPGEVTQIENAQDARLNNAQGQWRLARSMWRRSRT